MIVKAEPGTYVFFCSAETNALLDIGSLGRVRLRPGFYAYVGSALGAGGLRARLAHHFHVTETPRWHIDYLRRRTRIERVWYSYGSKRREHQWAAAMGAVLDGSVPVARFGSSDCQCASHLFYFESLPSVHVFAAGLDKFEGKRPRLHQSCWLTDQAFGKD